MHVRSSRCHRPQGVPTRTGHDDVGPRHRRARGARPADRLRGGRRHAGRHRGRLRRRRLGGADRQPDRRRHGPRRGRHRDQGRHLAAHRHPRHRRLTRHPARLPRRVPQAARRRPRRPVAGAHLGRRRARWRRRCRRSTRPSRRGRASYVGVSNYSGWQTAQAATWQRAVPGRAPLASTQMEYSLLNRAVEDEVVPAARALGLGLLPWSPLGRGVLTGKYRTGTPGRLARGDVPLRELRRRLPRPPVAPDRRGRRPRRRGAGLDARWRWRSPGCATGPG